MWNPILIPSSFTRLEHQRMHEKHKGHDAMHAEMIIILLLTLIVAQFALIEWKKRHYRSYSVIFNLEKNRNLSFFNWIPIWTVFNVNGPMDNTGMRKHSKSMVEIYILLVVIFNINDTRSTKSNDKTCSWYNT